MIVYNFILIFLEFLIFSLIQSQLNTSCKTPNNELGKCKSIFYCPVLLNVVQRHDPEQIKFIKQSSCSKSGEPWVCCGTYDNYLDNINKLNILTTPKTISKKTNLVLDRLRCGFQESGRILNGNITDLWEFPWMAMLFFKKTNEEPKFACGGALISSYFVITAAHCVVNTYTIGNLYSIRLGEWQIDTKRDCINQLGFEICNDDPIDVFIDTIYVHPMYDVRSKDNDIALIKLENKINFTDYIYPICLPYMSTDPLVNSKLVVSGWGRTESSAYSNIKRKLTVKVVPLGDCALKFRDFKINISNKHLCAGGEEGKDSCQGDSGGPLMNTFKNDSSQWYIEGIVSFGVRCGTKNIPGVYTRVNAYLDWIYTIFII